MYFKWSSSQGTKQHCCKNIQTTDRSMHGYFSESQKYSNESTAGTLTTSLVPSVICPICNLWPWLWVPVSPAVSEEQWGGMEGYASASAVGGGFTWHGPQAPHLQPKVPGHRFVQELGWLPGAPVHTNTLPLLSAGATLGYFWHKC